jgi:hypothetical protein
MQAKLTLSIDSDIIEQAKEYSRLQHKSLSRVVENYLKLVVSNQKEEIELSPIVAQLSGVISSNSVENYKRDYVDYLENKYR